MTAPSNFAPPGFAQNYRPPIQHATGPAPPLNSTQKPELRGGKPKPPSHVPRHWKYMPSGHNMYPQPPFFLPPQQSRTFEELHAERTYLLKALQRQNDQATDLLRRIANMEETLKGVRQSYDRRRLNKGLVHARNILREVTGQEKTILGRLGELTYEIQMKERMMQIESERQYHEQILNQVTVYHQNPWGPSMNPNSPVFYPQGYAAPYYQCREHDSYGYPQSIQYYNPGVLGHDPSYSSQNWSPSYDIHDGSYGRSGSEPGEEQRTRESSQHQQQQQKLPVGRHASLSAIWSSLTYSATNTPSGAVPVQLKRHSVPVSRRPSEAAGP